MIINHPSIIVFIPNIIKRIEWNNHTSIKAFIIKRIEWNDYFIVFIQHIIITVFILNIIKRIEMNDYL